MSDTPSSLKLIPSLAALIQVDVDAASAVGETPLVKACDSGDIEIVKLLIDRGANTSKCGSILLP